MFRHLGARLRAAITAHHPLIVAGTINAYCALLAERAGMRAIYLSGSGIAAAGLGLPDLGLISLDDLAEESRRITAVTSLPLIVDGDTGGGNPLMVARTVKEIERTGAAGIHFEDQPFEKRCGHREGKAIISRLEMLDRLKAAVDAREDPSFVLIARTDALATEGLEKTLERVQAYKEIGVDAIFVDAVTSLDQIRAIKDACGILVLVNLTEFGKTPSWSAEQVAQAGADIVLFPLSAFRAMARAAEHVYKTISAKGSTEELLPSMQTREELYQILDYDRYETEIDAWMANRSRL